MEKIKLRRKERKPSGLGRLLSDKKKRYPIMFLMMLPFLIAIGIFGFITYREAKTLMIMASGEQAEVKNENMIEGTDYILRDNATDVQKEYFAELKKAYESENEEDHVDNATLAGMVAKNYVADFYTLTNKQGQYDVGGLYYVYKGQFGDGSEFKENVYLIARDGFYKYLNNYINQYGADKLLEVENVEIIKAEKARKTFTIDEHVANKQDENGEWYDYREDFTYDLYYVKCRWTYKEGSALNTSQFANSVNLLMIEKGGAFYIIEASSKEIDVEHYGESEDNEEETDDETVEVSENE